MADDSLLYVFGVIAALIAIVVTLLYWDRIRAWNGHRREMGSSAVTGKAAPELSLRPYIPCPALLINL